MAITLLVTYGKFRMLDPADLTWNKDRELFCPVNRIGTVDLYQTANHGTNNANSPVMVHALQPRVVIADNGPRKGASARRSRRSNRRLDSRITGRRTI